jgi:type VI secretion system protein ImpG
LFNKYYEDELAFLREMGREFANANPAMAQFLAERAADPDVERLMEGFAFLTGRLRQKLDDELPELTQSLLQMLWPHYLRPIPSMSILQFEPIAQLVREPQTIPRGTEVESVPVEGTPCRFATSYEVRLLPMSLEAAEVDRPAGTAGFLKLTFRFNQGVKPEALPLNPLRLYLHGDPATCNALYLQLAWRLRRITVRASEAGATASAATLPPDAVRPQGYAADQALLPYPPHAFPGYRLLQEYFSLPQKFLFLDVAGLPPPGRLGVKERFEILFEFNQAPESSLRVSADNVRLHCTPMVNLFSLQSDPIRVDHQKVEYLIRPGGVNPAHYEIFSVDKVKGWLRGTSEQREYPSFYSFRTSSGDPTASGIVYYQTRLKGSVAGPGVDTYISFATGDQKKAIPPTETVVADLTCGNRHLAASLRPGDVSRATGSSPEFARFRNIATVSKGVTPPLGGDLHWRVISSLSLNYLSLTSAEALRGLLDIYNFQALVSRQDARENELRLSGIQKVEAFPEERLYRGSPVRGRRIEIEMKEANFTGEGGMVLFAGVLDEFLALFCTLNSLVRLVVRGAQQGEIYTWSPKSGRMALV